MLRLCRVSLYAALTFSCALGAQMSGTYTFDPNGSGPRNYTDMNAATFDLATRGVDGPVVIEIAAGTHRISCTISHVPGASSSNTITIRGPAIGTASIISGSSGLSFHLRGLSPFMPIQWINIERLEFTRAGGNRAISGSNHLYDIEIHHCSFLGSSLSLYAGNNEPGGRWRLHHNLHSDANSSFINGDGIELSHCRFIDAGISITNSDPVTQETRVFNNVFTASWPNTNFALCDIQSATRQSGLTRGVIIEHNTFLLEANSIGNCLELTGFFALRNEVRNNIFCQLGTGSAVLYGSNNPYEFYSDHNLYWVRNGVAPIEDWSGTLAKTLAEWQQRTGMDTNSMLADPQFVQGATTPYDLHLKPTSPAHGKAGPTRAWITDDFEGNPRYPTTAIGAYEGELPISFASFGAGCPGTGGFVPQISTLGDLRLGSQNLTLTLTNAVSAPGTLAHLAIGFSNQIFGSITLPFNFGGCDLLVAADIVFTVPVGGPQGPGSGIATYPFPIPNDPALIGAHVYFQWIVTDTVPAGTGLVFSNAGDMSF